MSDDREGDDLVQKLAELAKKKESEPPPELTNDVIINLAGLTPPQYAARPRGQEVQDDGQVARKSG